MAMQKDGKFDWAWDSSVGDEGGGGEGEDAPSGLDDRDLDSMSMADLQALLKDRDDVIESLKSELNAAQKASYPEDSDLQYKSYLQPKRTPRVPQPTVPRVPATTARYSTPRPPRNTHTPREPASQMGTSLPRLPASKLSPETDELPPIKNASGAGSDAEDEDEDVGAMRTAVSYPTDPLLMSSEVSNWKTDPALVEWWQDVQRRNAEKRNQQMKKANRDLKWILNRREKQRQRQKLQEKQLKEKAKLEQGRSKNMSWRGLRTMVALAGPASGTVQQAAPVDGAPLQWRPQPPMERKRQAKTVSVWCRPGLYTAVQMN